MGIPHERSKGLPEPTLVLRLDEQQQPVSFLTQNLPLTSQQMAEAREMFGLKPGMSPEQQLAIIKQLEDACRRQIEENYQTQNYQHRWVKEDISKKNGIKLALLVNVRKGLNREREIEKNQINQIIDQAEKKGNKLWALFLLKLKRANKKDDEELRKSLEAYEQEKQKKKAKIHPVGYVSAILPSTVYFAQDVPIVDLVGMKFEVAKFALEAGLKLKGPALDLFANTAHILRNEISRLHGNGEHAPKLRFAATEDGNITLTFAHATKEQVHAICQNCRGRLERLGVDVSNMLKNPTLSVAPRPEPGQGHHKKPEPEPYQSIFKMPTLKPPTAL